MIQGYAMDVVRHLEKKEPSMEEEGSRIDVYPYLCISHNTQAYNILISKRNRLGLANAARQEGKDEATNPYNSVMSKNRRGKLDSQAYRSKQSGNPAASRITRRQTRSTNVTQKGLGTTYSQYEPTTQIHASNLLRSIRKPRCDRERR